MIYHLLRDGKQNALSLAFSASCTFYVSVFLCMLKIRAAKTDRLKCANFRKRQKSTRKQKTQKLCQYALKYTFHKVQYLPHHNLHLCVCVLPFGSYSDAVKGKLLENFNS